MIQSGRRPVKWMGEIMEITIEGKTVDTGYDVFVCRNNGSWLEGCVDIGNKRLNVWGVYTVRKGDFKRMMNTITAKFQKNKILFTMVISDKLKGVLKGFEEKSMWFEPLKENMVVLEGEWKI